MGRVAHEECFVFAAAALAGAGAAARGRVAVGAVADRAVARIARVVRHVHHEFAARRAGYYRLVREQALDHALALEAPVRRAGGGGVHDDAIGDPAVDAARARDLRGVHVVERGGVVVDHRAAPRADERRRVQLVEAAAVGRGRQVELLAELALPALAADAGAVAQRAVVRAVEGAGLGGGEARQGGRRQQRGRKRRRHGRGSAG